ncbi:MAG: M20 family metallopeptidase [Pusillimonas sp.]
MPQTNSTTKALINGIRRWVDLESPSHRPDLVAAMAQLISQDASALGLRVSRHEVSGHEAPALCISNRLPDDERKGIVIIGHMDTVHPVGTLEKNPFRIEDNRAYGPGIYDMKAGAYMAMAAMGAVGRDQATSLPVDLLLVPDEEIGSIHSRKFTEAFASAKAKYVLVAEPARPNGGRCVTERKGSGRINLCACGRQAHAGLQHWLGRSAIKEIAHQVIALEGLTDYDQGLTISVGTINGGTTPNVVPGQCEAEADFRIPDLDTWRALEQHVAGLRPVDGDVRLDASINLRRPPMNKTPQTQALLLAVQDAAAQVGLAIEEAPMTGGASDANFTAALGIPSIDGLGADGDGAHTLDEYILVDTLEARYAFWCRMLRALS